ncbi:MAG: molybdenum ABC transporter ATP-binding protein [Thermoanaerobaculia bacterium]
MSFSLRLDLTVPTDRFTVDVAWETEESALGLFGPSGAGKTTVLESLAGLRRGARGRIEVGGSTWLDSERGIHLAPEERGVGYVPQDLLLFPHLDVLGNLRMGKRRARKARRRLQTEQILGMLELTDLARRPVRLLSGGERQRVALGRALYSAPDLLMMDEPLANLDRPLRRRILPYLLRVREVLGIPTLYVSHDPSEVALLASDICVLAGGRVTARGRPQAVFGGGAPATTDGEERIVNVFRGRVRSVAESLAIIAVDAGMDVAIADEGGASPGQRVAFELRGADILLGLGPAVKLSAQNVLAATVREVHSPPSDDPHAPVVVTAALARQAPPVAVVVSRRAVRELELAPGAGVQLIFKAQACRLLAVY